MSTETENNINLNSLNTGEFSIVRNAMGDWNNYADETGFYTGHAMKNSPYNVEPSNEDYWYVINICMSIGYFSTQIAIGAFKKDTYIRNKINQVWGEWTKLGNDCIAETINSILPISKGGTGAENVSNALKNLHLLNNNFPNNVPLCSALVYKDFSEFGLESMRMFEFSKHNMPDYSSVIFKTGKNSSAYITDIPSSDGILMFFSGGLNHKAALFFSTDGNNRGTIYHWSANSQVLLQNWKKINDGGNASTLDGKSASDFASSAELQALTKEVNNLKSLVSKLTSVMNKHN